MAETHDLDALLAKLREPVLDGRDFSSGYYPDPLHVAAVQAIESERMRADTAMTLLTAWQKRAYEAEALAAPSSVAPPKMPNKCIGPPHCLFNAHPFEPHSRACWAARPFDKDRDVAMTSQSVAPPDMVRDAEITARALKAEAERDRLRAVLTSLASAHKPGCRWYRDESDLHCDCGRGVDDDILDAALAASPAAPEGTKE